MDKNIPKLRFPEFEGEWVNLKLGELSKGIHSGKDSNVFDGNYPLYGSMGIIGKTSCPTYEGKYILVARVGANAGSINLVEDSFGVTDNTLVIENDSIIDTDFEYYLLKVANLNRYIFGSGQPLVTGSLLKALKVLIPTLPEQQKIASFFTAIDRKISQLKRKKTLLEQYKKGVMQKLFDVKRDGRPALRFKDDKGQEFPGWERKRLGDIGNTYNGLTGKVKEDFGTGKPYIQYKQIFDDSKIDVSRYDFVKIKNDEKQNRAECGDVFFTTSSETPDEVGTASVLLDVVDEVYLNSFCFGYRSSQDILFPLFSRYLFRNELFRREIIKLAQGSTRYNMSKNELMKLIIEIPVIAEQTQIANFLSAIDNKITQTQKQIEKAGEWKKGLMQQMFV